MVATLAILIHFILIAGVMVADVSPAGVPSGDESTQTTPPSQDGVIIGD